MGRFHLSLAVPDLAAARAFYTGALGCPLGRDEGGWVDVEFFGHQLTLHQAGEDRPADRVDHFGAVLSRDEWDELVGRCRRQGLALRAEPSVERRDGGLEVGKLLLDDPAGNVLEMKYSRRVG